MTESPFQKAYEFEERYGIDRLKITIQKAETAYKTYQPETIGYCKNIIESICYAILDTLDIEYKSNEDLKKLVGKTLKNLNVTCYNGKINAGICDIIDNLSTCVDGIGEIRNSKCITGHGGTDKKPLPTELEIDICVSTFNNILNIILLILKKEEINILKTKIKYSKIEEDQQYQFRNKYIDLYADIDYDDEEGILFINGKELRPSEILYNFDRTGYKEKFEEAFDGPIWDSENLENLQEMILERFEDECESFVPGHYGYTPPIVWFYSPKVESQYITGQGTIETIVTLGASKHGESFKYSSEFNVKFSYNYDKETNTFDYELLELHLDTRDWL